MDYASYADDTTPRVCRQNYGEAIEFLESTINNIFAWFKNNGLVANSGKSHFSLKILGSSVESSRCKELFGITIDSELTFHKNISCSKANQKPSALVRTAKYLNITKNLPKFSYLIINCPLIRMSHSRTLSNKIDRIQERALRIVYNDYRSNFKELLEQDHSFIIQKRNIQYLAIEAYKVKNGPSFIDMNDFFQFGKNSADELRSGNTFWQRICEETRCKNMGPYSSGNKSIKISNHFQEKDKELESRDFPLSSCRIYIGQVGFII